jgi:hypothetical protein
MIEDILIGIATDMIDLVILREQIDKLCPQTSVIIYAETLVLDVAEIGKFQC